MAPAVGGKNIFPWKKLLGKQQHPQCPKAETSARALEQNRGTNHFIPSSWRVLPFFSMLWAREEAPQCWEQAPQFIPRIEHYLLAVFMSEAVLGCFGLYPSCQNPLEKVSSGLSQILVQFLLPQDLSPADVCGAAQGGAADPACPTSCTGPLPSTPHTQRALPPPSRPLEHIPCKSGLGKP